MTLTPLATLAALAVPASLTAAAGGWQSLFDGRSFSGWEAGDPHWRVEEGAIVGEIPAREELRQNLFLFWEGAVEDFELRLEFRVSGHPSANSGVQFRSRKLEGGGAEGYQADIDDGAVWLGRIYDEHGRALLAERGAMVDIGEGGGRRATVFRPPAAYPELLRRGEWNEYAVRAVGPRLETFLNGELAALVIDHQRGEQDLSGRLALQLHSGPGPARIEFRALRLRRLEARKEQSESPLSPFAPDASDLAAGRGGAVPLAREGAVPPARGGAVPPARGGAVPLARDGSPLNLGLEAGTLQGWKASGEAWKGQPVRGDTVTPRRPGQASEHEGGFWLGGYELLGDLPTGTLESEPFEVAHPWASFLVGGGARRETRVEVIESPSGKVIASASGSDNENLQPVVVDLREHRGRMIAVRVVDEDPGPWGHINYDDFRFHAELSPALAPAGLPRAVWTNPLLRHLRKNPVAAPPRTPAEETVAGMYLPEGFVAEVIAAEPDVLQPIAFAIDERGRLWILEAHSYPQRRSEGEGKDRIIILADLDADGRFETRKVFAEGLNLASGLEVGHGGVWVGAAPHLLFLPDADQDDVPDAEPRVLLDGWGYQDTHETLNNFAWGPDGWLYGNHGVFNTSLIGKPGAPREERVELRAGVWRYHPVRHELEVFAHGGSNQWGLDFNERGDLFMTHCRSYWGGGPTTYVVPGGHYWNQTNARHAPFVSGSHPAGAPHFRNFLRASARYGHGEGGAGKTGSNILYGGHAHVGTMVYLGDNWPAEYRDHLFTHNLHGHRINHQVNERRGAGYETRHAGSDVLYAEDPRYIAVDLQYGPDGAVYIIDWYDSQHCHSPHPERWDRTTGRVYRIAYAPTFAPRAVDLRAATDLELASLQSHANDWYARTARRLLAARAAARALEPAALEHLLQLTERERDVPRVLRGLWTLHAAGALSRARAMELLRHEDEDVRAWAIRLGVEAARAARDPAPELRGELARLARQDASARVRLAVASCLAALPDADAWEIASALAAHAEDAEDAYLPRVIWFGIAPRVASGLDRAFAFAREASLPELADFVDWYAAHTQEGIERVVARLPALEPAAARRVLGTLAFALEGAPRREMPRSWPEAAGALRARGDAEALGLMEELGALFGDEGVLERLRSDLAGSDEARRRRAFTTLSRLGDARSVPLFIALLDVPAYRSDVIALLSRFEREETAAALLARFETFSTADRERALSTLTGRASLARRLLEAVVAGEIERTRLGSFHVRQLRSLRDARVDELVAKVWGRVRETSADARRRIGTYAKLYREAPLWAYEAAAGRQVFEKACASCHALGGRLLGGHSSGAQGGGFGPDLAGAGGNGPEYFLESLLDPNAVVGEDYQVTLLTTRDGGVLSGLVTAETEEAVTLRLVNETRVIEKSALAGRERLETSFMPEGLLDPLSEREVIELLKFLTAPR
jgi:putative membrane-bound dehydrogenase-like protein